MLQRALIGLLAFFTMSHGAHAADVLLIRAKGIINAGTQRYIERGIETAETQKAALLVIMLDTPGGLLNSTREIVQHMNKSKVPVAVYVAPSGASATSAGTIITMAAHYAAMAPGTNIGAAHPVGGQGEDIKGKMNEKAVNDTVAFIRAQAELRKRNADWAEQAIRKSASLPANEAYKNKVVDLIAEDTNDLIKKVGFGDAKVIELPMTAAEKFLRFIGDPNVSYLLMALGGLGLYVEITSPGVVLPGVLGIIGLLLAFISFSTLPVNYGGVALLVLGLIMFIAEAFVPSFGVLTIGGAVSLIVGALLLLDPSTGDLRLSLSLVIPTIAAITTIGLIIGLTALRARKKGPYIGLADMTGHEAEVHYVAPNGHSGKCFLHGELWDFELSDPSQRVHLKERVKVVSRNAMKLTVSLSKT